MNIKHLTENMVLERTEDFLRAIANLDPRGEQVSNIKKAFNTDKVWVIPLLDEAQCHYLNGFVKPHNRVSGDFIPSTQFFILDNHVVYDTKDYNGNQWRIILDPGFIFDGASIPPFAWALAGGSPFVNIEEGQYRLAAAIHDGLCDVEIISSKITHDIFEQILKLSGLSSWQVFKMSAAVKWFGPKFEGVNA